MDCNLGVPGLHISFSARASTTSRSSLLNFLNCLNNVSVVAMRRGFSERMCSPRWRSRRAKAPHPEIGEGAISKYALLKRFALVVDSLGSSRRALAVSKSGKEGLTISEPGERILSFLEYDAALVC